jgi:anti-sigma factor RsiW
MKSRSPFGRRHERTRSHLQSCHECSSAVRRERQYLERLRDAPIPPASDDLTARLLARTHELAATQPLDVHRPAAFRGAVRVLALTAGGSIAAAGVLAAGAFAVAGDPQPGDAAGNRAALSHVASRTPADGRQLSAEQLSQLRSEGWACPELEAMGFRLESARATVLNGQPAVELRLTDGNHHATVTEQRTVLKASAGNSGHTFLYESDLPPERADDALPILERLGNQAGEGVEAGGPAVSREAPQEPLLTRLQRGVNRVVAFFTP